MAEDNDRQVQELSELSSNEMAQVQGGGGVTVLAWARVDGMSVSPN